MPYQRYSIAEFIGNLARTIEERTGVRCVDDPDNVPSPLYSVEFLNSKRGDTKTSFVDVYSVWVHAIAEPATPRSNAPVLEMVRALEVALADDMPVPEPFDMFMQTVSGVQSLKTDPSGEGHAVVECEFRISYGFKCK